MTYLIGFIVIAAVIGAVLGILNGGRLKDVASGAAAGGAMGLGCLLQLVFAALPVIGGFVVIGLLAHSCNHGS